MANESHEGMREVLINAVAADARAKATSDEFEGFRLDRLTMAKTFVRLLTGREAPAPLETVSERRQRAFDVALAWAQEVVASDGQLLPDELEAYTPEEQAQIKGEA